MKKFCFIFLLSIAFLFFTGCSGGNSNDKKKENKDQIKKVEKATDNNKSEKKGKKEDTDTIPVSIKSPTKGDINSFLLFSSNIDSEKTVDIFPMASGIVEKINFDEGDRVNKGTVLAVLDDRDALINEKRAKITYMQQKLEFDRQKEIFDQS
jgi:multidrug efflux pump subunit AcrA (membrane-fusion protein)